MNAKVRKTEALVLNKIILIEKVAFLRGNQRMMQTMNMRVCEMRKTEKEILTKIMWMEDKNDDSK